MAGSRFYAADLARIHHEAFGGVARAAAAEVARLLRGAGIRAGTVVDLGCGSGTLLAALARAGYSGVGVERSASMLRLARRTAPRAILKRGSAAEATLPLCVAITATGEVLSYLPARRPPRAAPLVLARFFRRARRALPPGGLLVFDLLVKAAGPPMAYRAWRAGPRWAVLLSVNEDRSRGILERGITTFVARASGGYRRVEERHRLWFADARWVAAALRAAGFAVSTARGYGTVSPGPRRVVFIARARGQAAPLRLNA